MADSDTNTDSPTDVTLTPQTVTAKPVPPPTPSGLPYLLQPDPNVRINTAINSLYPQPPPWMQALAPASPPPPVSAPNLTNRPGGLFPQPQQPLPSAGGFGPASQVVVGAESAGQNTRELVKNPVTGQMTPIGHADGYFQIETSKYGGSGTWEKYAGQLGVLDQYPVPSAAPPAVQQAVANTIPIREWAPRTVAAVMAKYPWVTPDMTLGQINAMANGDNQAMVAPQQRGPSEWGRPDPGWLSGQPGMMPGQRDVPNLMQNYAAPLVLMSALAARMPLIVGLAAYGAMNRAQMNGQYLDYQMNKDKWQNALKEHQAQQTLEGMDVGNAMAGFKNPDGSYGDPQDLQQDLMQIAYRYQDPQLLQLAQAQNFQAIEQIQARRDQLNQPLMKWQMEQEKAADEHQRALDEHSKALQSQANDAAMDEDAQGYYQQMKADPANANVPDAVLQGRAMAQAKRDFSGKSVAGITYSTAKPYKVTDDKGQTTTQYLTQQKGSPGFTYAQGANTGQPVPNTYQVQQAPREGTPPKPEGVDLVSDKPGEEGKVVQHAWVRANPDGTIIDENTNKPYVHPQGYDASTSHFIPTRATATGGGRYGSYTTSVLGDANLAAKDLENAMRFTAGTTRGMFADWHGDSLIDAPVAALTRHLTPEETNAMNASMAALQGEVSTVVNYGRLGSNARMKLEDAAMPNAGLPVGDIMYNFAVIRQQLDVALENEKTAPGLTGAQQSQIDKIRAELAKAIPFTPEQVQQRMRGANPAPSYSDVAGRAGLAPQTVTVPDRPAGVPSNYKFNRLNHQWGDPSGQDTRWFNSDGSPASGH